MILQPIEFNIANLLHSNDAVAVCQLEGKKLKDMMLNALDRGCGLVVVETPSEETFLIFRTGPAHQGNLVGDVRRWTRQYGYQFFLKLSSEVWTTPRPDVFALPDGREIQIRAVLTMASFFTHWGLSN